MRKLVMVAFVAVAAVMTGCLKFKNEWVVMPDGSGKITITFGMSEAAIKELEEMGKAMGGKPEKQSPDLSRFDDLEGIVAVTEPVKETKDGFQTTTVTFYFEDVNKVRFNKKGMNFRPSFRKDGDGYTLEIEELGDDSAQRLDAMTDEEKKAMWEEWKPRFEGLEVTRKVTMPGAVTEAEGLTKKEGRSASSSITYDDLKNMDDASKIRASRKLKIVCGKDEVPEDDVAAFKKELEDAKKEWARLKEERLKKKAEGEKGKDEEKEEDAK